jgi:fatty acid desaturase
MLAVTCGSVQGMGWLVGGLHYHGVHHAFPGLPFYRLPEAFQRVQAVLSRHKQPAMVVDVRVH